MDENNKKYILITGGAGFIGSYICKQLVAEGEYTPIIVDLFVQYINPIGPNYSENRYRRFKDIKNKIIIKRANCANYATMHSILEEYKPEYIIHLAAIPLAKIQDTVPDDFKEGTIDATSNILHAIFRLHQKGHKFLKKFVYTSSSMVYGNFKEDPVKETHSTNPINVYGSMKLAGEVLTKGLCSAYGLNYIIIRPSAVYGPTDMNKRVSQIFVENAIQGDKIVVKGGKHEKLDFSYVKDVAEGFIQATLSDSIKEIFNITGGSSKSLLEFAEIVKKHFPKIDIEITERDKDRPKRGGLNITKAKNAFNYNPKYNLEKGIKEYIIHLNKKRNTQ